MSKNRFEAYKNVGLSLKAESNFNILRGIVLGSPLDNNEKKELCSFLTECEQYFSDDEDFSNDEDFEEE